MTTTNPVSSRLRRSGLTRSLSGAAAAVCTGATMMTANAEIIYSGLQNLSTSSLLAFDPTSADSELVNIDGAGLDEFSLSSFGAKGSDYHWLGNLVNVGTIRNNDNHEFLLQMEAGNTIGVGKTFEEGLSTFHGVITPFTDGSSQWPAGSEGYFGYRFNPSGSQELYGWGHATISSDAKILTLVDWAYENTGAPIQAGNIPEPCTSLLLAASLTIAALWRRR